MDKRYFIITIDTEGDNLWRQGNYDITTENARFLPRFQELCEKFGFIPTWLTNYEMIQDDFFIDYFKQKAHDGLCEIGMHLHAWNSPPDYDLKESSDKGHPYLIQYPDEIMFEKAEYLTKIIEERIGIRPTSHRAGRWVMDKRYFSILSQLGYVVDSSVTPHINWKKAIRDDHAVDYSCEKEYTHYVDDNLLEVPVTIRMLHPFHCFDKGLSLIGRLRTLKKFIRGTSCWLRPMPNTYKDLLSTYKKVAKERTDVIVFMMHSSELMPGGSPYFKSDEDIEELYNFLNTFFALVSERYMGITLTNYARKDAKH